MPINIRQLTTNTTNEYRPAISGTSVVWYATEGSDGGTDNEIFYYNGTSTRQLTTNTTNETFPDISSTNINIVWNGTGGSDGGTDNEIFYYNGTSTRQLTTNTTDDLNPRINGTDVVWYGAGGSDGGTDNEIFYYNGTSTRQLTTNTTQDLYPGISGTNVVWHGLKGSDGGSDTEIFYYNGRSTRQLTTNTTPDSSPVISGTNVAWNGPGGSDGGTDNEIFYYNGTSTRQLTTNTTQEYNPGISGTNVAWYGTRGSDEGTDNEIFYYNGTSTRQLTTNTTQEYNPVISGTNIVAWYGSGGSDGGTDNEIFLAEIIPNSTPTNLSLSNNSIKENTPAPTMVGTLSTTDANVGDTFTYSLVSGLGSDDNSAFSISGNQLLAKNSFDFESKSTYSIRVRTTDSDDATFEKALIINVTDVLLENSAPTNLSISNSSLQENQPPGSVVGTLTSSDGDTGDTFTYSLVSGTGSDDNSAFSISGDQLLAKNSFDFENKSTYTIRVRTTDSFGATFEKVLDINVTDVLENSAPTNLSISNSSLLENQPPGSVVGTLTSSDADTGDTFTYSLVSGTGSDDNSAFSISGDQLLASNSFDFENKSAYTIRVRTTDSAGATFEKPLDINVTDVLENSAPTNLSISNSSLLENQPPGSVVGTLSSSDPDAGNTFTYSLVSGPGSEDNSAFSISGDQLLAINALDFENKSTYSIRVKTTDSEGASFEKVLGINVTDVVENSAPTDISVSNSSIAENTPAPALVGTLSSSDADTGDTFTYSLVSGTGSDDNSAFSISGDQLLASNAFDSESQSTYSILVRTTDSQGATFEKVLGINVTDVDESGSLSVSDASVIEGNSLTTAANFVVSLSQASSSYVLVDVNTSNYVAAGSDYQTVSTTVTFNPGETSQTVSVSINGDTTIEPNERFLVKLANPVGGILDNSIGVGTIINDDYSLPSINITDSSITEGNSGTNYGEFTVSLSASSSVPVSLNYSTVNYSAIGGTDFEAIPTTALTFNPGETTKTISVGIVGDTTKETNEKFLVSLTSPINATWNNRIGVGTILNDDGVFSAPLISVTDGSITEGDSGTKNLDFTVSLSASSAKDVTLNYSTNDTSAKAGTDYQGIATTSLTFNPGETTKTISVAVLGDSTIEGTERFFLNLNGAVGGNLENRIATATIFDNDTPPTINITDSTVTEGNTGRTDSNFVVSLSQASTKTVTVAYNTTGGTASSAQNSDYVGIPAATLTFNPGETQKTISVKVNGDSLIETTERFFLNLSSSVNGTFENRLGVGTILNDDLTAPSIPVSDKLTVESEINASDFSGSKGSYTSFLSESDRLFDNPLAIIPISSDF